MTRASGARRAPPPRLRLFAAVLAVLHLAAPVAAVAADPAPPVAGHVDHVGAPDSSGCHPSHDELFCLSCRVLFTPPVRGVEPQVDAHAGRPSIDTAAGAWQLPDDPAATPLNARAPPRS